MIELRLLYFARLREAMGLAHESVSAPAGVGTLGQLRAWLISRGEPWAGAFASVPAVRIAQDQVLGGDDTPLRNGAEIAFFPPVTGG
jgi:molybdopterin synthase sulfur carrier subunit